MAWRDTTLGSVVEVQRGYDLPEVARRPGSVPVCGSAGVNGWHDVARARGPGVTIGRSGASIGVVNFVKEDYWPHNTVLFVTDFKGNDPRFVAFLLQTIPLADLNSGSAQPSLNRNFIYPVRLRIPSLSDQRRIASILSAYDDLIENNTRRIGILEEMARQLYEEWFVCCRFPGYEKVRFADAEIGRVPQRWPVQPVSRVVEFDPPTRVPREGLKPFVPMSGLSTTSMLIDEIEIRTGNGGSKFRNGDTLFARITPCLENGKTAFVNFLPAGDAVAFGSTEFVVMRGRSVCPQYVYCLARSSGFREHAIKSMSGATGRQRVQSQCFDNFLIAAPDPDTNARFELITGPMFELIRKLAEANRNLRTTRDVLLPKLISGEIDVGTAPAPAEFAAE